MIDIEDMVREFADLTSQKSDAKLYEKLVVEEYHEWVDADTRVEELKEMGDLVYVLFGLARAKGYDLTTAIKWIHKNNLGRITQPDGTIKRRRDGKILKNKDHPKVLLEDLV